MSGNHFIHSETGTLNIKKKSFLGVGRERELQKDHFCIEGRKWEDPNFIPVKRDENGKCVYFCNENIKFNILGTVHK